MSEAIVPLPQSIDFEQLFTFVTALRSGDFSARLPVDGSPRAIDVAKNLNRFMEQMDALTSQVKRVCGEVGSGLLGGQVEVSLPPGPWRECVESVNLMAYSLTNQIRDLNNSAKLLAQGKTARMITVPCERETLELKTALNSAIERMQTFG
jgi:methyl-accepting chemotaxis protein